MEKEIKVEKGMGEIKKKSNLLLCSKELFPFSARRRILLLSAYLPSPNGAISD